MNNILPHKLKRFLYIHFDRKFYSSNLIQTSWDRARSWNTPKSPVRNIPQVNRFHGNR